MVDDLAISCIGIKLLPGLILMVVVVWLEPLVVVLLLSDVTILSDAAAAVVSAREGMIVFNSTMNALQCLNRV